MNSTVVLKFGGASLKDSKSILNVAEIIISRKKKFIHVVAVVSAMGTTTDDLIALAKSINPNPPKRELDMLVSIGERVSISLLAMALERKGVSAISFTGSQTGIITTKEHHQARIIDVRQSRLLQHLKNKELVIVAGFQGVSEDKEITTLGRGGSDTSAVALGVALGAEHIDFFKDLNCIYTDDPKKNLNAKLLDSICHDEALVLMKQSKHQVLHERALKLAKEASLPLWIRSYETFFDKKELQYTIVSTKDKCLKKESFKYELTC